ncbi:MAG: hypothetical protein Q4E75_06565, partial [bacterium]|nr:hypothetical protein [bacterium]
MKKRIFILLLIFISLFCFVIKIKAEEQKNVTCVYKLDQKFKVDGDLDGMSQGKITIPIVLNPNKPYETTTLGHSLVSFYNNSGPNEYVAYGTDSYKLCMFDNQKKTDYENCKYQNSAVDYFLDNNTCPMYFYLWYNSSYNLDGWYSDHSPADFKDRKKYKDYVSYYGGWGFSFEEWYYYDDSKEQFVEPDDDEYSCSLLFKGSNGLKVTPIIRINYTKKNLYFDVSTYEIDDYVKNFNFDEKNKCPNDLKYCYSFYDSNTSGLFPLNAEFDEISRHIGVYYKCLISNELYESGMINGHSKCNLIDEINKYNTLISENKVPAANDVYQNLRSICNTYLNYDNFNGDSGSCFNMCLNLNSYLEDYNIQNGECGFSSKLVIYISNVVRWLKYIIPVIVIGLGILDFIKAMSQDKDDEM